MLGLSSNAARAAAGSIRWEDRFDLRYTFPVPPPIVVNSSAVIGKVYYVAGAFPFLGSPGSNANIHVRAYNIGKGNLRWESIWAPTGSDDAAVGLVAASRVVVVAGRTGLNSAGNNAFVVQAFSAAGGALLWGDKCGAFGPSGATAITSAAYRVFVAGSCAPAADGNTGLLRAYQADTGKLLWEVRDGSTPLVLAAAGGRLFEATIDASRNLMLRAYDPVSGVLLWEIQPGTQGTQIVTRITAGGSAVYLAWESSTGGAVTRGIAAYDASTGAGLWQVDPWDRVTALRWDAFRLFAGHAGGDTLLTAYDTRNGTVLWQDQPGSTPASFSAEDVTVGGGRVFVVGNSFSSSTEAAPNWLVRAYTLQGRLLWEDNEPSSAMLPADATNAVWGAGSLIAAGSTGRDSPPFGMMQWWLRSYDATLATSSRSEQPRSRP